MATQVPSIGRVVHWVGDRGDHYPAMITEVVDNLIGDNVHLCVFTPIGIELRQFVAYETIDKDIGTWHWPEFVPAKD